MSKNGSKSYYREFWSGNSRDGRAKDIDGYHYLCMDQNGEIIEAFEWYETIDGEEMVSIVPEMIGISWYHDLGYEDLEDLEVVKDSEFERIKDLVNKKKTSTSLPS